jgi:hypothetical protein
MAECRFEISNLRCQLQQRKPKAFLYPVYPVHPCFIIVLLGDDELFPVASELIPVSLTISVIVARDSLVY